MADNNMDDERSAKPASIEAPSYVELMNLVAQLKRQSEQSLTLQAEVEALRKTLSVANVSEPVVAPAPVATSQMRPEYRVVPDLSCAMTTFAGDETPLQAED